MAHPFDSFAGRLRVGGAQDLSVMTFQQVGGDDSAFIRSNQCELGQPAGSRIAGGVDRLNTGSGDIQIINLRYARIHCQAWALRRAQ
jgi:hypothetical protein